MKKKCRLCESRFDWEEHDNKCPSCGFLNGYRPVLVLKERTMSDKREYAMKWVEARKRLARLRYEIMQEYGWLVFLSEVGEQ